LTESMVLAIAGGVLGAVLATYSAPALASLQAIAPVRSVQGALHIDLHIDWRAILFSTLLCLIAGFFFGLAPALRAGRTNLTPVLGQRGEAGGGAGRGFTGRLLVVSQVGLSMVLIVGAILFVRTLRNLKSQDLGFDREHLLLVWSSPAQAGRRGAEAVA